VKESYGKLIIQQKLLNAKLAKTLNIQHKKGNRQPGAGRENGDKKDDKVN
jgi:hypothetical protein